MLRNIFHNLLIEEQLKLSKKPILSKFDLALKNFLYEQEMAANTMASPPETPQGGPPQAPNQVPNVPEKTELPPDDLDIEIKLAKLAALSLFTDVDSVVEKYKQLKDDFIELARCKKDGVSGKEDALRVLQKTIKLIKAGGNEVGFNLDSKFIEKFDPAANDSIVNLIVKVLFISKDKLLQNNDSLRTVLDTIGGLAHEIKPLEIADPTAASEKAAEIVQKINTEILPAADLTI